MSFEERMKGEKSIIGYPVSGHPLEGIEEFVRAKSKNIGVISDWIEKKNSRELVELVEIPEGVELAESVSVIAKEKVNPSETRRGIPLGGEAIYISETTGSPLPSTRDRDDENLNSPAPIDPDDTSVPTQAEELQHMAIEKVKEESIFATLIGLVHDVRKIQTKSGGMMLMATVESVGFDFKLVIFPRDYEAYEKKVIEDMIVIVDGRLRFDTERDEISISPG